MKSIRCLHLFLCLSDLIVATFANSDIQAAQNWAILVAGGHGYLNYRYEANVCHAYQDLMAHGIPQSNIITMMYDDIVNDTRNPYPGKLINQPDGPDVYHGVVKDFTDDDVTAENFLKVLLGDSKLKARGKKVLESGPDDNVFIFFTGDGGDRGVFFQEDYLPAQDIISTLKQMYVKKMYNKLLFYLEAARSGSVFDGFLPNNISALAIAACGPTDFDTYCFCDGPEGTCLGGEFSVNWLLDSDVGKVFENETVGQQFLKIKNEATSALPQAYGDLTIANMPLSAFHGPLNPSPKPNPYQKCDDPWLSQNLKLPVSLEKQRLAEASLKEVAEFRKKLKQVIEDH